MPVRLVRAAVLGTILLLVAGSAVASAADVHLIGHFTQQFGGRNGDGVACADDAINCGSGRVEGYGRATDAFYYSDEEGFRHTLTLADGSSVTVQLDYIIETKPGGSGESHGFPSYGNPDDLYFDAVVIGASGIFAGAEGGGVLHLSQAGNVDQITADLELALP